jgi:hypothetical protein
MTGRGIRWAVVGGIALVGLWAVGGKGYATQEAPQGQLTWAIHFTIAPTYFEPAEHQGIIHSYAILLCAARRTGQADAGQYHGP